MKLQYSIFIALSAFIFINGVYFRPSLVEISPAILAQLECVRNSHKTLADSTLFVTSEVCNGCHGSDMQMNALVDAEGRDVNIFDDWKTTMMANAAKDPYWRAKISQEIKTHPQHAVEIENTCTKCHAPMGYYQSLHNNLGPYTIDFMLSDTLGLDGVSCGACHQLAKENIGTNFSGTLNFDTNRIIYGPYPFPFSGPMQDFVGFTPRFGDHILDSEVCASCHTLITTPFDDDGQPTTISFVEQATYHEWLNSVYSTNFTSCQNCHLPQINDGVIIASGISNLTHRIPFGLHELTGSNTFMIDILKKYKDTLGIDAEDEHFDSTLAITYRMLQQQSLDLDIGFLDLTADTIYFDVELVNKAGHKFPSGYPARRLFVEFLLVHEDGDTIFHSGKHDAIGKLAFESSPYESHHNVITSETQTQIYEMVSVDVNGDVTTILERAVSPIKDNRLPPQGFTTTHAVYDTTRIAGTALNDPDFNKFGSLEGSGIDVINYKIPIDVKMGFADAIVKVYYQSIAPLWLDKLFEDSTAEIDLFENMVNNSNRSPVMVKEVVLFQIPLQTDAVLREVDLERLAIEPNIASTDQSIAISTYGSIEVPVFLNIYDLSGKRVHSQDLKDENRIRFQSPDQAGIYNCIIQMSSGRYLNRRLVVIR